MIATVRSIPRPRPTSPARKLLEMEASLFDARGLSKAMVMAIAGMDKVAMDKEVINEALKRLAVTIENNLDDAVRIWGETELQEEDL